MAPAAMENGGAIDGYGPPITRKAPTSLWVMFLDPHLC